MKAERQKKILDYLDKNGAVTTQELIDMTGSSPATVRRDLHDLREQDMILKTRGGAQSLERGNVNGSTPVSSGYRPRNDIHFLSKKMIASKAAEFIGSGNHVFIGAGMTGNLLCRCLKKSALADVTVVTSNVTATLELAGDERFSIVLLGGTIHAGKNHIETLDDITMESLSRFYFDKAFFTVDGADPANGYTISNRFEMALYRYVLHHCEQSFLMLGSEKLNRSRFTRMGGLDEIKNVITDQVLPEEYMNRYRQCGVRVLLAERNGHLGKEECVRK